MSAPDLPSPYYLNGHGRPLRPSWRQSIENFIESGLCGTAERPASWGLLLAHKARLLPDIPGACVVLVLRESYTELHAAIVAEFGPYDPMHKKGAQRRVHSTRASRTLRG